MGIPDKESYRLSEVCQYTDTQPYVLRFWESEFPQLNPDKRGSGQPLYSRADIDLVQRIKELLYDEDFTLADARERLESETRKGKAARPVKEVKEVKEVKTDEVAAQPPRQALPKRKAADPPPPVAQRLRAIEATPQPSRPEETVDRQRYQDAIDAVEHLRLQLKDAEKACARAEDALAESHREAERQQRRCDAAIRGFEQLRDLLS